MNPSVNKGNNKELWNKFLKALDEKLQLGLLDHLGRINSYHFEDNTLFIAPGSPADEDYFRKEAVFQQLQVFAGEVTGVEKVQIQNFEE